ncbi:TPA: ABC transporter permease [Legionella pneumophila]|nr:ABC transporter permease [Legionella pneumophila]HEM6985639.1 ABC transporter permease [Legionella pneumophila]HEM7058426.1 ABC transporter permease [Legionella pneumophila]
MLWHVLLLEIIISLNNYRLRSLLNILGISIGICSVFLTLNISNYINHTLEKELSPISRMLIITPQTTRVNGVNTTSRYTSLLTEEDGDKISQLKGVNHTAPLIVEKTHAISSFSNIDTIVMGSSPDYFPVMNLNIIYGVSFSLDDIKNHRKIAVIGSTIRQKLFPQADPLSQFVKLNNVPYRIIGVIETQGQSVDGKDRDNVIVIPISTARENFFNNYQANNAVDYIILSVKNPAEINSISTKIVDLLTNNHRIKDKNKLDFKVLDRVKEVNSLRFIFATIGGALMLIGVVSLVISGIGISTLMLMSVSERKSEIGLRKAIGATDESILIQILLETAFLALIGGVFGSILGVIAVYIFSTYIAISFINSYFYLLPCCLVSLFIGLISGVFPAYRTTKIQPVTALNERH